MSIAHAVGSISRHHPPPKKTIYNFAKTTTPSASSVTPAKSCLIILNRLKPHAEHIIAVEQAGVRAGRSTTCILSTSDYYARSTSNINKIYTMCLWTSRKRLIGCGTQHFGPLWRCTTSTPTSSDQYKAYMTRPPVQSTSTIQSVSGLKLQLEYDKVVCYLLLCLTSFWR